MFWGEIFKKESVIFLTLCTVGCQE